MLAGPNPPPSPQLLLVILWIILGGSIESKGASNAHIRISEFCASNIDTIADEDGDYPDWIELENPTEKPIDLRAYFLTDEVSQPNKYRLPSYVIAPGERALIFASGKTKESSRPPFHAPFKLQINGEYLALFERESGIVLTEFSPSFPKQVPGFSYGITAIQGTAVDQGDEIKFDYLKAPTPGKPNTAMGTIPSVPKPSFSQKRGFFQKPFQLSLGASAKGTVIRYSIDASEPSANQGVIYSAPIQVDRSQIIRAIAIRDGRSSRVATHSFLFPTQIILQETPVGFPEQWGEITADYEMDPRITKDPIYRDHLIPALQSLPSISIATSNDHLFGAEKGIYANPSKQGIEWERPVSIEWIGRDGKTHQIDSGLRIQGGWFRGAEVTRKHSFRLLFKRKYGEAKLEQNLFNEFGVTDQFDSLILRAGGNDGFSWHEANGSAQYIRDEFGRRVVMAMRQPAPRGRFVHLYLNGCYWGLYNLCERPNEDFSSSYQGGRSEIWDSINTEAAKNGTLTEWSNLKTRITRTSDLGNYLSLQGKDSRGERQKAVPQAFNVNHYIDYLLANMWLGNADWPDKNYWIGLKRGPGASGVQFYPWDMENTMGNSRARSPLQFESPRENVIQSGATEPHFALRNIPEYRLNFADRVQKHLVNQGALSTSLMRKRYEHWSKKIELAIIAEAARWGDDHSETLRTPSEWKKERDWILDTYIPQRGAIVLEQLRNSGLYPRIDAPIVIPSNGTLTQDKDLLVVTTEEDVYYTVDGSDPRIPGGELRPSSIKFQGDRKDSISPEFTFIGEKSVWHYGSTSQKTPSRWRPETLNENIKWKAGLAPLGAGTKEVHTTMAIESPETETVSPQPYILRKRFALPRPLPVSQLKLWIDSSDAIAVFLNGEALFRSPQLPMRNSESPFSRAEKEITEPIEATITALGLLHHGKNELLVFIHQRNADDKKVRFDLTLTGTASVRRQNLISGTIATPPFGTLKARSRKDGRWSALTELDFTKGIPRPTAQDFGITEISFNPSPTLSEEERLVTRDSRDFEYLKLSNRSPTSYNLSGMKVVSGIEFEFPRLTIIKPKESIYITREMAAFTTRFGRDKRIVGPFSGRLDNVGEELQITFYDGQILTTFNYQSKDPWPVSPEDSGFILKRNASNIFHDGNLPTEWKKDPEPIKQVAP
jgi:hypothetical protein